MWPLIIWLRCMLRGGHDYQKTYLKWHPAPLQICVRCGNTKTKEK